MPSTGSAGLTRRAWVSPKTSSRPKTWLQKAARQNNTDAQKLPDELANG